MATVNPLLNAPASSRTGSSGQSPRNDLGSDFRPYGNFNTVLSKSGGKDDRTDRTSKPASPKGLETPTYGQPARPAPQSSQNTSSGTQTQNSPAVDGRTARPNPASRPNGSSADNSGPYPQAATSSGQAGSAKSEQTGGDPQARQLRQQEDSDDRSPQDADTDLKNEKAAKLSKQMMRKSQGAKDEAQQGLDDASDPVSAKSILDILGNGLTNAQSLATAQQDPSLNGTTLPVDAASLLGLQAMSAVEGGQRPNSAGQTAESDPDELSDPMEYVPGADPDTHFQFATASADDRRIERWTTGNQSSENGTGAQAKFESITVLDARRYLALAPDSNAFQLVANIAGDKELSNAITASLVDPNKTAATSKVVNTLKLQMNPHDLGTVTATLRLRGEELSVSITVQNAAAYNQLTSDQDKMMEALRAQGFTVDQVTIQLVTPDRSAFQDQQQPGNQPQQQPRDGAATQQGRQQGHGSQQGQQSSQGQQNLEAPGNRIAGNPGGRLDDGQVYL
jgi:chemotaxis protein MotD